MDVAKMRARFFSKTKLATEIRTGMKTPCLVWQAGCFSDGYGQFRLGDKSVRAHRAAWEIGRGPIPDDLFVLHKCDNPKCVFVKHLFLGTNLDNVHDMMAKRRQARGDAHSARMSEVAARGDANGARRHPERLARGDANGARLHPESRPRGDAHYARLYPERLARGEANGSAKLNEEKIRSVFQLRDQGFFQRRIADELGVSNQTISKILARKKWAHVEVG